MAVSIPRSGFCWFGLELRFRRLRLPIVSIPRSGFCWFGRMEVCTRPTLSLLFQSLGRDSVGLDFASVAFSFFPFLFQSLGRDSVGLDLCQSRITQSATSVSIPRSGFCWFGPASRLSQAAF